MKIAFIVGEFPNLSEIFILNQITGLISLGHDIEIISLQKSKKGKVHGSVRDFELLRKLSYFPKTPRNKMLRVLKAVFLVLRNFHRDPKKIIRSINLISMDPDIISLKILFYIIPFLKKEYDILHFHFGNIGNIGVYLKKGGIRGKLVTTFYGYDLSQFLNENRDGVFSRLFTEGDLFLPICSYFRDKLQSLACDPNKIIIHHVGIDLGKYRFKKRVLKDNQCARILSVGRLCEKKGFSYGLKAIKELVLKGKNISYTIVGGGPLYDKLQLQVKLLNLESVVTFSGPVDQDELIEHYSDSHIFLLPSITGEKGDQEGTPTVLLEAQAVGLPVISTFHSGIPEIVKNGFSGFLVEERDFKGIADKIELLLNNHEELERMGKEGRKLVKKSFDINKLCRVLAANYHMLYSEESKS